MRIIELVAENVKRLKVVSIRPDRSVVQITGANGSGKSSVLDSIFYVLAGTRGHPSQPVRRGEQRATITASLGDTAVELVVRRRFTAGGTSLEVSTADGMVFKSPQAMLDALLGALTFDPLAFARLAPDKRLEQLRRVVKVGVDLDALDTEIAQAYARRTEANREGKAQTERANHLFAQWIPAHAIADNDVSELLDAMRTASDRNVARTREHVRRDDERLHARNMREEAAELRAKAEEMLRRADHLDMRANTTDETLDALEPIADAVDTASLMREIEERQAENATREHHRRLGRQLEEARGLAREAIARADELTSQMEQASARKAAAIAAAVMPIPGLSFGAGEITYNGIPFGQASSAEQIRVAVAIGIALNPKLRILTVKDGSLLDEDSLAALEQIAEQHDVQVWLERVDRSGAIGIQMVDGEVASIDGVPVRAESELASVSE